MKRPVLMISPVPTDPVSAGNRARICAMAEALRSTGADLHFAYFALEPADRQAMAQRFGPDRLHWFDPARRPPSLLERVRRKIWRLTGSELQWMSPLDGLYDKDFDTQLEALQTRFGFEVVLAEYVFMSKALDAFPSSVRKLIDTHDVFADRHRVYLQAGERPAWVSLSPRDELRGLRRADAVIAIQDAEAGHFRRALGAAQPTVGVVGHFIELPPPGVVGKGDGAMFIGSSNPINVQAARFFIDRVMPLVRAARPDFRLHLVGEICGSVEDDLALVKHGRLASLGEAFATAPLAVNPVLAGTGLNIKLIDSLAHGAPMITTETGARGLPADLRAAIAVAPDQDAPAFAQAVLKLLDDPALRARMAAQARDAMADWNRRQRAALAECLAPGSADRISGDCR